MSIIDARLFRQAPGATNQASFLAASNLATLARDRFWAARRDGDQPAMIHWSAKENTLRRHVHGLMTASLLPACTPAVA